MNVTNSNINESTSALWLCVFKTGKLSLFSSFHDHKDDLRKRLSYTTHKLEMVETEFDSTRQYLETELRRAQEELEKFTEKLRRCVRACAWLCLFMYTWTANFPPGTNPPKLSCDVKEIYFHT